MSMPPRYGHVLIMHLLAVEYSQRLSSNWGSLGLVVSTSTYSLWFIGERELQYLMKMRQIVLKPLGRGGILVFCCGSTYHSVWWDPLFVRERERHTHTHTHTKLGTPEIHSNAPITEVCIMSAPIYFLCASPVGTVTAYTGLYLRIKLFTSQTINTNHKYWSRHTWRRFKGCNGCVCWE
jgi:hypothetical protein